MSESRCDLPPANATYLGIGFGSCACRYVILLGIGYGASVLRTYVPMSACILFPFAGEVVSNSPYVTASTVGIAIVIETMFCGTYLFAFTADALEPVSVCVIAVYTV